MANSQSYIRAKAFRRLMTPPEARLWERLRAGRLNRLKFRRQHPIGPFILDFFHAETRLAIEVDGGMHNAEAQIAHDRRRTAWLSERGIRVVRLRAEDVRDRLDGVIDFILDVVRERRVDGETASPPPGR
jgi:very-short-patch-repair endonuclease